MISMNVTFSLDLDNTDVFSEDPNLCLSFKLWRNVKLPLSCRVAECLKVSLACLLFDISLLIHTCRTPVKLWHFHIHSVLKLISPSTWQQESLRWEMDEKGTEKYYLDHCQFTVITYKPAFEMS